MASVVMMSGVALWISIWTIVDVLLISPHVTRHRWSYSRMIVRSLPAPAQRCMYLAVNRGRQDQRRPLPRDESQDDIKCGLLCLSALIRSKFELHG